MTTESSSSQAGSQPERLASPEEIVKALGVIQEFRVVSQKIQRSAAALTTVLAIGAPYIPQVHNSQATGLAAKIAYFLNHPGFCFMEGLKSLSEDIVKLLGWLGISVEGIWLSLQSGYAAVLSRSLEELGGKFFREFLVNFSEMREEKQLTPSFIEDLVDYCKYRVKILEFGDHVFNICVLYLNSLSMDLPLIPLAWSYACPLPTLVSLGLVAETQLRVIYQKLYAQPKCTRAHLAFIHRLLSHAQLKAKETWTESLVHITFKDNDTGVFLRALDAAGIIFYGNLSQGIAIPISKNHQYSQKDFDALFSCFEHCYEEETRTTQEMTDVWNTSKKRLSKLTTTLEKTLSCQNIRIQNLIDLETAYELHLLKYRVTVNPAAFNEAADYLAQLFRTDQDPAAGTIDIILRECNDLEKFDHECQEINQRFLVSKWLRERFLPAFSAQHHLQSEWCLMDHQWPIECRANTPYKISPKIDHQISKHLKCYSGKQEIALTFSQAFATTESFRSLAMPENAMANIMAAPQFRRVRLEAASNAASGSRDPLTAPSSPRYFLNGKELDPHCVTTFRDSSYCAVYISPEIRAYFANGPYQVAAEVFQGGEDTHFTHDGHGKGACWLKRESRPTLTNGRVIVMKAHLPNSESRVFFEEHMGEYEKRDQKHSMRFFTPVAYGRHQEIQKVLPAHLLLT